MKKSVLILIAVGLFGAVPSFAADNAGMKMDTKYGVRECALQAESIHQKIERLNSEIAKGTNKYSAMELRNLELNLNEANNILDQLNRP